MAFGLNKHTISFEILDNGDPNILLFLDTSDYYRQPESPLLEIVPPGYDKYFLVNIAFSKINVLNSGTIGFSDILEGGCLTELPDGIWSFKFKVCPYDEVYVSGYRLRTVLLEHKLADIYRALDFSDCDVADDEKIKKNVIDIILAIESGKANAKSGSVREASDLYKIACNLVNKTLRQIKEDCQCA